MGCHARKPVFRVSDQVILAHFGISVVFTHVRYLYQPMGKIINEQLHVGRTSIGDVIVMFKLCHHVASQRIQDFLQVFFMFVQYKMKYLVVNKEKTIIRVRMG